MSSAIKKQSTQCRINKSEKFQKTFSAIKKQSTRCRINKFEKFQKTFSTEATKPHSEVIKAANCKRPHAAHG